MIKKVFTTFGRAHNLIINADSLPANQSIYDEKKKEIKKFGASLRHIQGRFFTGYIVGIAILLFGVITSWNGIVQPSHGPMTLDQFKSAKITNGYVDITAHIAGKYGTGRTPVSGTFNDMNLSLFLIVDKPYRKGNPVFGVLGMTKGNLKRLVRKNPGFSKAKAVNKVNFKGLAAGELHDEYKKRLASQGVKLSETSPLIIAYQSKSIELQGLAIFAVIAGLLLLSILVLQINSNRKYLPELIELEDYIKKHTGE